MEEGTSAVRRREERRRRGDDATRDAVDEATALDGTRHSSRLAESAWHDPAPTTTAANLMGLCIPTRRRTAMKMRPRDLRQDHFIASLVKKKIRKEEKGHSEVLHEVTVDTQEEHEVAEALYCLANIKTHPLPPVHAPVGRQNKATEGPRTAPKPVLTKRKSQRSRRTTGGVMKRKMSSHYKRSAMPDDGSLSSGSFEKMPRSRTRSRSGRPCSTPFRKVFREGGKRVYHPQPKAPATAAAVSVPASSELPVRRHVIHQQPTRPRQKTQPIRAEEATPERVMLNGHGVTRQEEKMTVPEERYLPKAVLDALKGVYGDGLICTTSNEQSKQERSPSATSIKRTDVTHPIQLKCEERSNESEAGTPVVVQQRSNSARHLSTAHWIQSHRVKKKEDEAAFVNRTLSFSQARLGDVLKNLPPLPVQKEPAGMPGQFYPSLPLPSSFSNFSMSLQPLPQSLIQSLQNSASHMTPLQPRFPPLSGHPPPLVRASEPWETNR